MDAMYVNQVWTLVDPLERVKLIGCKWVFKRKIDMDGKVQMYKVSHPKSGFVTGQRQTYTYASEALTYRTSGMTFPL